MDHILPFPLFAFNFRVPRNLVIAPSIGGLSIRHFSQFVTMVRADMVSTRSEHGRLMAGVYGCARA